MAFIEVNDEADEQAIETAARTDITWVYRYGANAGTSSVLEEAIRDWCAAGIPQGEVFVWAGGEANQLRGVRRYLLNEAGFEREWTSFSGHCKCGVADHDHHEPIED